MQAGERRRSLETVTNLTKGENMSNTCLTISGIVSVRIEEVEMNESKWQRLVTTDFNGNSVEVTLLALSNERLIDEAKKCSLLVEQAA